MARSKLTFVTAIIIAGFALFALGRADAIPGIQTTSFGLDSAPWEYAYFPTIDPNNVVLIAPGSGVFHGVIARNISGRVTLSDGPDPISGTILRTVPDFTRVDTTTFSDRLFVADVRYENGLYFVSDDVFGSSEDVTFFYRSVP